MTLRRLVRAPILALVTAGCWSDGGNPAGLQVIVPGVPPIVVSAPDSFSMIPLGPIANGTYDYDWVCNAGQANLTVAGITGGSVRVEIEDAAGAVVHDNTYIGGLMGAIDAFTSPDGIQGEWRLRFTFRDV